MGCAYGACFLKAWAATVYLKKESDFLGLRYPAGVFHGLNFLTMADMLDAPIDVDIPSLKIRTLNLSVGLN